MSTVEVAATKGTRTMIATAKEGREWPISLYRVGVICAGVIRETGWRP